MVVAIERPFPALWPTVNRALDRLLIESAFIEGGSGGRDLSGGYGRATVRWPGL